MLAAGDMTDPTAIAAALSAETGQPWARSGLSVPTLTGPDGAELYLREQHRRLVIGSAFGDAYSWRPLRYSPDSISVAADTAPERTAREIARRLLPGYLPALATARAALARHQAAVTAAEKALAELLALAGSGRRSANTREIEAYLSHGAIHRLHVAPREEGPAVLIELHRVDVETAREVVRLLAGRAPL